MSAEIKIDIDNYLSEEEKKEIARDYFRETLKIHFCDKDSVLSDAQRDRHLGNITHHIIFKEVQKYIPNYKEFIEQKVLDVMNNKNISYEVFREKSDFGSKDSLAIRYINDFIEENKQILLDKVIEKINSFDYDKVIIDKLQNIMEESVGNIYDLFDKLKNKNQ